MKQPAKPTTERPKALDVLVDVTELARHINTLDADAF